MIIDSSFWIFNAIILVLLLLDLFIFHRKNTVVKPKEALWMSACWISIALLFNIFIYYQRGTPDALNFLTGYLVEKMLSVDNLFVFLLIFSYFRVPDHLLHKVLFWGVFGAIIMRAIFILFGIALVEKFHWLIFIFGGFLIITGLKLLLKEEEENSENSSSKPPLFVQFLQKFIPITNEFHADKFFIKQNGRYFATPLFLVLLAIETTDVIFAVDSIPAIIGITRDAFIVYTSNILAILGLRSLYFALSHLIPLFHYLDYGLAFILIFIGVKMLFSELLTIPILLSLSIVIFILGCSIAASILYPRK